MQKSVFQACRKIFSEKKMPSNKQLSDSFVYIHDDPIKLHQALIKVNLYNRTKVQLFIFSQDV